MRRAPGLLFGRRQQHLRGGLNMAPPQTPAAPPRHGTRDYVRFRRSRFVARFPRGYRYSPAHFWLAQDEDEIWRIGLTHFATRMLGDIVEFDVELQRGDPVDNGQVIGWIEGMKAVTDLFCVAAGEFVGLNPDALQNAERICKDPYGAGWLYAVRGEPDEKTLDVETYLTQLGETIDEMEKEPWRTAEMH
ncbi:MAG: glycine cleavage system protein H [Acidobacteriota bacterium]